MKEVVLTIKETLRLPVAANEISPDSFAGKSKKEIEELTIWEGNKRIYLRDIIEVEGDGETSEELGIRVIGDASKIRYIGHRMSSGSVTVEGDTGMYLGYKMKGGKIAVKGDAGHWTGSRMTDGFIEVEGNAGDLIGSPYRGSRMGMKDGLIIIHGDAGADIGLWMRGGTIRIKGNSGMFPGMHMSKGRILVEGDCEGRAGAQMIGGRVVVLGHIPSVLPSFSVEEKRKSVKVAKEKIPGPFYVFSGDNNENGNGKLYISIEKNPHLSWCEKYMI
ncbi:MAG: formylmethanofuran dehydrogenase subunit C [Nitrososphaeria archaeon]|nr:formylmethanofuran dehydrogenase subunit C [Nitrososphaeria archaeon]NIN51610.1 formylmethanofuran dehydrogenase subunit C [Nitrososphaeria archaeon]NIQ32095.1 formylmethanofuran dehydrogenase subunit C [Nitrososphaeria archaeon]